VTRPDPRYEVLARTALSQYRRVAQDWEYLEVELWITELSSHPRRWPSRHARFSPDGHEIRTVVLRHPAVRFSYIVFDRGRFEQEPWVFVLKPIQRIF
jgi:hypothetical protein